MMTRATVQLTPWRSICVAMLLAAVGSAAAGELFETFEDVSLLPAAGWVMINNSELPGSTGWLQGDPLLRFSAEQGPEHAYIAANFNSSAADSTISNWLLTPEIELRNGLTLTFWTRRDTGEWEDRLQVRMSTAGASTNVGTSAESVGDFHHLLLDINPDYDPGGYPVEWTRYLVNLNGISEPATGRIALRYFVEEGGPAGPNSDFIGIRTLRIEDPAVPLFEDRFESQ